MLLLEQVAAKLEQHHFAANASSTEHMFPSFMTHRDIYLFEAAATGSLPGLAHLYVPNLISLITS